MLPKFSITPSKHLGLLLLLSGTGGIICLLASAAPVWLKCAAIIFCLAKGRHIFCIYALLAHPKSIVHCTVKDHVLWQLTYRNGNVETFHLLGDSWKSRWAVILNFRQQSPHLTKLKSKRLSILLPTDSLEKNAYRRLQAYLNLSANPNA